MPKLKPFRALRYDAASTDLSAVLAPPYDIISPAQRQELLEQDQHNAVRIELPADLGSSDADAYRGAAQALAQWREDGTLVMDTEPTVTVHQMSWVDADGREADCMGLLARLQLEEFAPGAGVLPHERTMSGPKADRLELLRATELNTSPLAFLAGSDPALTSLRLRELTDRAPDGEAATPDGVTHRIWICDGASPAAATLLDLVSSAPLTIADGHHRYETALTYRAERAAAAGDDAEADPAWDYVMALVYPLVDSPPALPTHRVIRGKPCGEQLLERLEGYFTVEVLEDRETLLARMSEPHDFAAGATGTGRIGVYTAGHSAMLKVDQASIDALLDDDLSEASRGLDVNALTAAIGGVFGEDAGALAGDGRLRYVKDAFTATQQVRDRDAATAFLLDPMPAAAISSVAEAGEVMPQKSTYFNPKAPTGLLFSPLEW